MENKQSSVKSYSNFTDEEEKRGGQLRTTNQSPQTVETPSKLLKPLPAASPSQPGQGNRMTIKEEESILSKLQKIALGMLIAPIIITGCGLVAYFKTEKHFLVFPPFISLIALCATLCVYFSAKSSQDSLTRHKKMATQWNGIVAQDVLTSSLYVLHISASCYFFIGIISFISDEILLGPIDNPELHQRVKWMLFFISGASLKYILGYLYVFHLACKLSIDYETIQNYVQTVQLSVLLAGIGLILCPGVYWWYWSAFDISEELSPIIIQSGIASGILIFIYTHFSFFAAYKEKVSVIILSQIVCIILFIFLGLYCMLILFSTQEFQNSVNTNCFTLLRMMQDKHLSYLGCSNKYLDMQLLEGNLECPKEQVAKVWETDMEGKYGCLNPDCCEVISTSTSAGLDYIIGFCITGMILLVFAWESMRNLLRKIERFGPGGSRMMDKRIYALMLSVILISIAIGFALRYEIIANIPSKHVKNPVKGVGALDAQYMGSSLCFKGIKTEPLNLEGAYEAKFSVSGGTLGVKGFKGTAEELRNALAETRVCPDYVGSEMNIEINLYISRTMRFLDEYEDWDSNDYYDYETSTEGATTEGNTENTNTEGNNEDTSTEGTTEDASTEGNNEDTSTEGNNEDTSTEGNYENEETSTGGNYENEGTSTGENNNQNNDSSNPTNTRNNSEDKDNEEDTDESNETDNSTIYNTPQ